MAKLLFGSNQFYETDNQPKFLSKEQAGKPGERNQKHNTRVAWRGRREMYIEVLDELIDEFKKKS